MNGETERGECVWRARGSVSEFSIFSLFYFGCCLFFFGCCFSLIFSVGYCELFVERRLQHSCGRSARFV